MLTSTVLLTGCNFSNPETPGKVVQLDQTNRETSDTQQEKPGDPAQTKFTIKQITDDNLINTRPQIKGENIVWTQFPSFTQQEYMDVYIYNISSASTRRVGYMKEVFGNVVDSLEDNFIINDGEMRGLPKLGENHLVWLEYDLEKSLYALYSTQLSGKLQKKLISSTVSDPTGFFELDYSIDGTTLFYRTLPVIGGEDVFNLYDLANGRNINTLPPDLLNFNMAMALPVKFENNKFYFIGYYRGAETNGEAVDEATLADYGEMAGRLMIMDLLTAKLDVHTLSEAQPPAAGRHWSPADIYRVDQNVLYWTEFNPTTKTTVIKSYNPEDKTTQTLTEEIPAKPVNSLYNESLPGYPELKGFDKQGNLLVWAVTQSANPKENGLFIKNLETGETQNVLENSPVNLVWDITRDNEMNNIIDNNRVVFIGYEGTLKDDYSNINIYLADIPTTSN